LETVLDTFKSSRCLLEVDEYKKECRRKAENEKPLLLAAYCQTGKPT
jgi:hypothetical protein